VLLLPTKAKVVCSGFDCYVVTFFVRKLDEHVGEYGGVCGVKV